MREQKPAGSDAGRGQHGNVGGRLKRLTRRVVEAALEAEYAAVQGQVDAGRAARGAHGAEDWTARLALAYRQGELAGLVRLAERLFGAEYAERQLPERARARRG